MKLREIEKKTPLSFWTFYYGITTYVWGLYVRMKITLSKTSERHS